MRFHVYLLLVLAVIVLGACNTKTVDETRGSSDILYTHNQELKQNFEGVRLVMTYVVRDVEDAVQLEITGTLANGFSRNVYYTPAFIVEDQQGVQYMNEEVAERVLVPEDEVAFTEKIKLPTAVYEASDTIRFFVPAVFTQSGSISSGDALGDTVWWELPLK